MFRLRCLAMAARRRSSDWEVGSNCQLESPKVTLLRVAVWPSSISRV